ncbi:unnamed protein product [Cladocopium goreaui]|uniref:Uncharacterized protein n=1 Tax=Cladocopium goreaui TaxID=2562237 RepID=A0A9P1BH13_9DINO|nr:unnamed protein product [Cladocopium goreaui]
MKKSIYETFRPRVELLDDWADLRGSRSLLEVMPPHHTVLSPLLRLTPEGVAFPTPIEVEVPTCSGAESAWRSTATVWENVEISLVRDRAILVLRHFCDVIVSGRCAIRAMGFIKLDQPVAKLAVTHATFEELFGPTGSFASVVQTCFLLSNTVGNDDEELRGFRECGPTARLGTYNPDENLNIKVPGAGCIQLKMRFHRFPLVSPKLDTPSKMSFSTLALLRPITLIERPQHLFKVPTLVQVGPSPAASSSASGHASSPRVQSVQASQPEGHLLLSGRFKSDGIFTAEQIMGYMRMVGARLAVRGVPTFMVEAKPGQSFAELTRMGLGRAKGMVAFCTAEYGAYTGVGYETFYELEFAHDKELLLIPIRLCEVWPPAPTDNEKGAWQNKLVFTNGLVYIDDRRMQNAEGVADQIADSVEHLRIF